MEVCNPTTVGLRSRLFASGELYPKLVVFFATLVICLAYAAYTNHAWEDWYITFRASKNFAAGKGLTFTEGERVYSYTSPLGTTVPAICSLLTGNGDDQLALWLFRSISALLLAAGNVNLFVLLKRLGFARWAVVGLCASLMLESKTVDHTINGMETGFMVFFITLTIMASLRRSSPRPWLLLGLAWGGLMWSRPDGFVYGGALAVGFLAFPTQTALGHTRRDILRNYVKAFAEGATLYLPWLIATWSYYGSPVPHTITAKSLEAGGGFDIGSLMLKFVMLPFTAGPSRSAFEQAFTPSYAGVFGGWPEQIFQVSRYVILLTSYYWLNPHGSRIARAASMATMFVAYYLTDVTPNTMPWYLPNLVVIGLFAAAAIINDALRLRGEGNQAELSGSTGTQWLVKGLVVAFLLFLGTTLYASAVQSRWQQRLVEDEVRTEIGRWLRENANSSKDTVMLECLGYIGFFSGLKMYDYPGMGTPEMVAARKKLSLKHGRYVRWGALSQEQMTVLIRELKPDWLVLRLGVALGLNDHDPRLLTQDYRQRKLVSTLEKIREVKFLPGRAYLEADAAFVVFSRNPYL